MGPLPKIRNTDEHLFTLIQIARPHIRLQYHKFIYNIANSFVRSKHLFQRLALLIQKENAALIFSRSTDIHHFDMLGEH